MTLSGSEAYSAGLMFYNSTKNASKSKIQKAETIYDDLAARFPRGKKANEETATVLKYKPPFNQLTPTPRQYRGVFFVAMELKP